MKMSNWGYEVENIHLNFFTEAWKQWLFGLMPLFLFIHKHYDKGYKTIPVLPKNL